MHIQQSVNTVCYLYFINTDNLSLKYSGYESRQLKISSLCFFAGDRHWMSAGILLPIPIIEYQAIKLSTFIVNYYQIPSTVINYLHNNINQLLKELSVKGTK